MAVQQTTAVRVVKYKLSATLHDVSIIYPVHGDKHRVFPRMTMLSEVVLCLLIALFVAVEADVHEANTLITLQAVMAAESSCTAVL